MLSSNDPPPVSDGSKSRFIALSSPVSLCWASMAAAAKEEAAVLRHELGSLREAVEELRKGFLEGLTPLADLVDAHADQRKRDSDAERESAGDPSGSRRKLASRGTLPLRIASPPPAPLVVSGHASMVRGALSGA